ncbi:MAG: DNA-3-methyladenine glycosylase I [Spirochaetia bacterium]
MNRCPWSLVHPLLTEYHDTEWGVPLHDEQKHFEFLLLESMQAGLSWLIILKKREAFRQAFDGFDPEKIAEYSETKTAALLENPGIIRNRRKIAAAVSNAGCFLETAKEFGSFDRYIWSFTDNQPVVNRWDRESDIPATTPLSDLISADLKARGFKFVGSTIIYAHLQAIGVVDDHLTDCFRKTR